MSSMPDRRARSNRSARARRRLAAAGLTLAALGVGCAPSDEARVAVARSAVTARCSDGRSWVTELPPGAACPQIDPWTEASLLGAGAVGAPAYCSYAWTDPSTTPSQADIDALQTSLGAAMEEDCIYVSSLASPLDPIATPAEARSFEPPLDVSGVSMEAFGQQLRRELRARFAEGAGAVKLTPPTSTEPDASPVRVRVAVLDTEPDSQRGTHPGVVSHGAIMAGLIGDLSCPVSPQPAACAAEVVTKLALPHRDDKDAPDWERGGEFGTIGELAQAISASVDAWERDLPSAPRLVLSLSVGIQPGPVCAADPTLPTTPILTRALYDAVRRASCRGALLVTAAGNAPDEGGYAPGATCPAAWASLPVPSAAECAARFGPPRAGHPDPGTDAPLVYAVHGLDARDAPVANARDGARGWLAAVGLLGVSSDGTKDLPAPLTGSSVAAAAVSGIAATVWAYRPDLSARQVMEAIHATGAPLSHTGALCPSGTMDSDPPVSSVNDVDKAVENAGGCSARRASLCHALEAACAGDPARCPPLPPCAPHAPRSIQNEPLSAEIGDAMTKLAAIAIQGRLGDGIPAAQPAPSAHDDADIWVRPQPTSPPCGPACGLDRLRHTLFVSIDPAYRAPIAGATLWLTDSGGAAHGFGLGGELLSDRLYAFDLMEDVTWARTATISFQLDLRMSIGEQIVIR